MDYPLRAVLLLIAYLALTNKAHAQPMEDDRFAAARSWDSEFTVDVAVLGPLGFFALEAEYAPIPEIGISAGVGVHQDGPQFGLMSRLRTLVGHSALGIGVGPTAQGESAAAERNLQGSFQERGTRSASPSPGRGTGPMRDELEVNPRQRRGTAR